MIPGDLDGHQDLFYIFYEVLLGPTFIEIKSKELQVVIYRFFLEL